MHRKGTAFTYMKKFKCSPLDSFMVLLLEYILNMFVYKHCALDLIRRRRAEYVGRANYFGIVLIYR